MKVGGARWWVAGLAGLPVAVLAHLTGEPGHDAAARQLALAWRPAPVLALAAPARAAVPLAVGPAAAFAPFAPAVRVRVEGDFLLVESEGLPAHGMMTGITAWQQQVPLPQPYTGANAWRIPLNPVPAGAGTPIRDRFLRGAIALAVNGVPIFNPQNNRGAVSADIGELDRWGGHCGRADDYHYHIAPLHLEATTGVGRPIAYALDGYPILGLTEPDGSTPAGLDAWRGHESPGLGYHYHASETYPFLMAGFRGVVVEREGQVDPQPRAQGVREALTQLRGARITGFEELAPRSSYVLRYEVRGATGAVAYRREAEGVWRFRFEEPGSAVREVTYRAGERRGGGKGKAGAPRREP